MEKKTEIPSIEGLQFHSVDDVKEMIRKLQQVEIDMKKRESLEPCGTEGQTSYKTSAFDFNDIIELDLDNLPSSPDDQWLTEYVQNERNSDIMLNIYDDSYMDSGLRNIQYSLLNSVKAAMNEDNISPIANSSTRVRRNLSYVIRRDSELSTPNASPNLNTYTPPSFSSSNGTLSPDSSNNCSTPGSHLEKSLNTTIVIMNHSHNRSAMGSISKPENLNATITKEYYSPKISGLISNGNASGPNSPDLNTTFTQAHHSHSQDEMLSTSSNSNNSVYNTGDIIDELHTKARFQEESLAMSTPRAISRKDTQVIDYVNYDELPKAQRTWSSDTYCVDESNPPSDQSSGVSSPRDSQSCENVQIAGTSIGRSMPNLAHVKELNSGKRNLFQVPPPMSLRKQPHYISDSRLARPQARVLRPPSTSHQFSSPNQFQRQPSPQLERPYTVQTSTLTRGRTFQKPASPGLSLPIDHGGRAQNQSGSHGQSLARTMLNGQGFQTREAGGRSVPRQPRYAANVGRDRPQQFQPAYSGPPATSNFEDVNTGAGRTYGSPASTTSARTNNIGSSLPRPSNLPRFGSRIPAPGANRTQWPNRSGQ